MTASFDHLHPKVREVAGKSVEERIAWLQVDRWVKLDRSEAALAQLEALLAYPTRGRMPCLLIHGTTGMGKSEILERFHKRHPWSIDTKTGRETLPVLLAEMPPEATEIDFYEAILDQLNYRKRSSGTARERRGQVIAVMADAGVRVLMLDEIDKMLGSTPRQQRLFLNSIRYLTNQLRISIVCAGATGAQLAIRTDPNLADRFASFELHHWQKGRALEQLLVSFSMSLPLCEPSDLTTSEMQDEVIKMTDGVTGRIFRLFEALAIAAIVSGRERIDLGSLRDEKLLLPLVSMEVRKSQDHAVAGYLFGDAG